jgi:hypothetical protein
MELNLRIMKNAKQFNLSYCLPAFVSLLLLPGWLHAASAASPQALPEQDVWRRWEAAREARRPKSDIVAAPEAPTQANKASSILGMAVRDSKDQYVGRVQDVVVDWQSGRVAYAVVQKPPQTATRNDGLLALPPAALKPSPDHTHLVLDAGKSNSTAAFGFTADNWPSLTSPGSAASRSREDK